MKKKLIINAKIVTPGKIINGEIKLADGKIIEIGKRLSGRSECEITDARRKYVMPGFIDIHTNGAAGFDISCGAYNAATNQFSLSRKRYNEALENALRYYLKTGTTTIVLSGISAPVKQLMRSFKLFSDYRNSESEFSRVLYGLYIEGSFIKDSGSRGAQNPKYFLEPSAGKINEMQRAARNSIAIINIPPEWGRNASALIKNLSGKGIICAIGHSSAEGDEFQQAVKSGSVLATHFLNGPSSASFKPFGGGGVVEAVLKTNGIFAEIIPDGYHIDKSYVLDVIKRKGFDKIISVTDSMYITGIKKLKAFNFLGVEGAFGKNSEYIYVKKKPGALFGSVVTMDTAFSNLISWLTTDNPGVWNETHKSLKLDEAVLRASQMCSGNASDLLSKYNPGFNSGKIETGRIADLIIADLIKRKNGFDLKISERFLNGERINP